MSVDIAEVERLTAEGGIKIGVLVDPADLMKLIAVAAAHHSFVGTEQSKRFADAADRVDVELKQRLVDLLKYTTILASMREV